MTVDAVAVQPHQHRRTGRHRNTLRRGQHRDGAHLADRYLRVACLRIGQHLLEERRSAQVLEVIVVGQRGREPHATLIGLAQIALGQRIVTAACEQCRCVVRRLRQRGVFAGCGQIERQRLQQRGVVFLGPLHQVLRIVGIDQGIQHRADRLERDGRGAVLFLGVCGWRADSERQENSKSRKLLHGESSVIAATRGARSLAISGPVRSPCAQP
ncbi:hypothetical protein D3C75_952100 [compost metagenome]